MDTFTILKAVFEVQKDKKLRFFQKGFVHGFGSNWPFFHSFFYAV